MEPESTLQRLNREHKQEWELPGADLLTRLRNRAILCTETLVSPSEGYEDDWAESFENETADHAKSYLASARAALTIIRSGTERIPEWNTALEHIQECGRAAIRGENTVVGDDPEHTEELEQRFQAAQELADSVEAAVKEVIAFLEGRNAAETAKQRNPRR